MAAPTSREEMVEAKRRVREMREEHELAHVTIDVELEGEVCASSDEESEDRP